MKDYQKQRVYAWQNQWVDPKMPSQCHDVDHLRMITDYMWNRIGMTNPPNVNINTAYKTKSTGNRANILLMPGMNDEPTLVHELAHSLNLRHDREQFDWHGPNYIADFASLLSMFYNFDIWHLIHTLKVSGVDVNIPLAMQNLSEMGNQ